MSLAIKPTQIYLAGDNTKISDKVINEIMKATGLKTKDIIRIK
jgi:hypothetical protein